MVSNILDSAEAIIKKLLDRGMSPSEVKDRIKKKQDEYGGLLTEAGAAYSVAKEAGIDFEAQSGETKIKDLKDRQLNVNLTATVERASPVREFEKDGRKGTVANLTITDGTGSINLVVWNKDPAVLNAITKGTALKILNSYVKSRNDSIELNIGNLGALSVVGQKEIDTRTNLKDLKDNAYSEIRATIVDVFKPTILEVCSNCGSMMKPDCPKCGKASANYSLIVNAEMDDGTDVIRGTFYRQTGEKFLGLLGKELKDRPELFDARKRALLGEEYIFEGETKFDQQFDRMNFIVRSFNKMDVQKELARVNKWAK